MTINLMEVILSWFMIPMQEEKQGKIYFSIPLKKLTFELTAPSNNEFTIV